MDNVTTAVVPVGQFTKPTGSIPDDVVQFLERKRARQRIKAAAPELLAALKSLLAQYDKPHGFDADRNWYGREFEAARSAIAKAEGRPA